MPVAGDSYCYFHTSLPSVVQLRDEARSKGGKHSRRHLSGVNAPRTIEQATELLADIVAAALNGEIDLRLAATASTALKGLLKAFEVLDLAKRIAALEKSKGA